MTYRKDYLRTASRRTFYKDGGNYCRWCGDELPDFHRTHCSTQCVADDLADAVKSGDDRKHKLASMLKQRRTAAAAKRQTVLS